MAQRLVDRNIKSLVQRFTGDDNVTRPVFIWDQDDAGFGLKITPKGHATFIVQARTVERRSRRMTIGPWPRWSATAARARAKELLRQFDAGEDPARDKHRLRSAPTVGDLCDRFLEYSREKNRPQTVAQYEQMVERHIRPAFGPLKAHALESGDVGGLHRKMKKTPAAANRMLATISRMYNLAMGPWKWNIAENPAKGIERYGEEERERFLNVREIRRLLEVLDEWPWIRITTTEGRKRLEKREPEPDPRKLQACDAIRLLLFTGARVGETLSSTWDQFDLDKGVWTKPAASTKQAKLHRVPLSGPALAVLMNLRARRERGQRFLFLAPDGKRPQSSLKAAWRTIRKRADIEDVRIHDLRHSYASLAAAAGVPLETVGRLMGHTKAQTTKRYVKLWDEPLRVATDAVAAMISGGEGGNQNG